MPASDCRPDLQAISSRIAPNLNDGFCDGHTTHKELNALRAFSVGGTAGQPILGGIESEGVSEVMVVVTRYSGGIKLGTGGLCRAYGGGSRLCLQAAERCAAVPVESQSTNLGRVRSKIATCM